MAPLAIKVELLLEVEVLLLCSLAQFKIACKKVLFIFLSRNSIFLPSLLYAPQMYFSIDCENFFFGWRYSWVSLVYLSNYHVDIMPQYIAIQKHSPLRRMYCPTESWLSSSCLISLIIQKMVLPS